MTPGRIAGCVLLGLVIWRFLNPIQVPEALRFETGGDYVVTRIVDGDTLELADGRHVRLIGVDTPEYTDDGPAPFADQATQFTRQFVFDHNDSAPTVKLVFDRQRLDRYKRVLAFVYVKDKMLNNELIRAGLATAEPQYDYRTDFKRLFKTSEEAAQDASIGIWSLPDAKRDLRNSPVKR